MLRAIERTCPEVYWLLQSGQASVIASWTGYVKQLRLMFQSISDEDLRFLSRLPHLRRLELLYCQNVTNRTLEYLADTSELRLLKLEGTSVSGFGLRHLKSHQNLEVLSLDLTLTGTTGIEDLKSIPQDAANTLELIRTCGLCDLAAFPNLRELHVDCRFVGDGSMEGIAMARSLEHLIMAGVNVSDEGLKHLYGHPHLKTVVILGPKITEAGKSTLKQHLPAGCKVT